MSLIKPEKINIDPEIKLKRSVNNIKNQSKTLYNRMDSQHKQIWNIIWNNVQGFTPQEIFDEFGSDAASLFVFSSNIQNMLHQVDSNYEFMTPPLDYTINPDGTVTINDIS